MLKFNAMTTAIRIQSKTINYDIEGFPVETWTDIIDEDIPCEWKNKYGVESYRAAAVQAREPATLRLWYIPNLNPTFRVVRMEDEAIFDIVNIDNIGNRHQQLEIEVKRYVPG